MKQIQKASYTSTERDFADRFVSAMQKEANECNTAYCAAKHIDKVTDFMLNLVPIENMYSLVRLVLRLRKTMPDDCDVAMACHTLPPLIDLNERMAAALPSLNLVAYALCRISDIQREAETENS